MKAFFAALAACASLLPGSAAAEPATGSRIDPAPGSVRAPDRDDEATAARVMNTFARCIARQRRRAAEVLVALPYRDAEQNRAAGRLVGGEEACMGAGGTELRFQAPLLVGGIAEQFIVERYANTDLGWIAAMSPEESAGIGLVARNETEEIGLCVVARDAPAVRRLVVTRPATSAEGQAIASVIPHLGPCITAGSTIRFSQPALRALLSVSLYRALTAVAAE